MTKEAALYAFFSKFGLTAVASSAVTDDMELPYLTYDVVSAAWGDGPTEIFAQLWYYGDSEKEPNAKAREIAEAIGLGGVLVPCDGGAIWLKRGVPWCQNLSDTDPLIKRRYLKVSAEFFTLN